MTDTTTPEMPESIYAWGHWNAGSVTGEWSANTHDRDDGQDYIRADLIGGSLSAPAPAVDVAALAEHIGYARLLIDTGFSQMGVTVDYSPTITARAMEHLDKALRILAASGGDGGKG